MNQYKWYTFTELYAVTYPLYESLKNVNSE